MFLGRHVYSFILNKPKPYSIGNAQEIRVWNKKYSLFNKSYSSHIKQYVPGIVQFNLIFSATGEGCWNLLISSFFWRWWFTQGTSFPPAPLIPSSDMILWMESKLNTSNILKQIHYALFSIPENLMMPKKVCKISLLKRNLVLSISST